MERQGVGQTSERGLGILIVRKVKTEMPAILTIGHSTRTWKDFLAILRAHGIKRVIDVRSIPRSRHNPQFNRETLSAKLRSARIGYVHLRKLGGLRHARRDSPNMGWRNASFRGFADYMQTSDFEVGLHRLLKLARFSGHLVLTKAYTPADEKI